MQGGTAVGRQYHQILECCFNRGPAEIWSNSQNADRVANCDASARRFLRPRRPTANSCWSSSSARFCSSLCEVEQTPERIITAIKPPIQLCMLKLVKSQAQSILRFVFFALLRISFQAGRISQGWRSAREGREGRRMSGEFAIHGDDLAQSEMRLSLSTAYGRWPQSASWTINRDCCAECVNASRGSGASADFRLKNSRCRTTD